MKEPFAAFGPNLLAGLAVLVLGWLVALIASFLVRKLLSKTSADNKIASWISGSDSKAPVPVEKWAGTVVFYFIMVLVLIAFFSTIRLTAVTEPQNTLVRPFLACLPRLVGAGVLVPVAWGLATVLKNVIGGVPRATKHDEVFGGATEEDAKPMALSNAFAEVVYWLVFLIFLRPILQVLDMTGLMEPGTTLFNKVFAFLPNIISASVIGVVGWFIARIVQRLVQSLLASAGVDKLSEKWSLSASLGRQKLSGVPGLVVYFVILMPVLISALGALQLDVITRPASDAFGNIMGAMTNIIGAAIILLFAVVIGKVISGIASNLLAKEPPVGKQTPAAVVGMLLMGLIVLFAAVTATDLLEFPSVGALIQDFIGLAGHILMGTLIFGLGMLLVQIMGKGIAASDSRYAQRLATVARVVILAPAGAMALRQTVLVDDIVNLAFGLTLGAAAVAFALSFGPGGRELAGRTLEEWRAKKGDRSKG